RLKTTDGKIDDFASMREASYRRYSRLLRESSEMPDLLMIDGGIGQVNAVQGVLDELNLDIPIVGLAKQDEELYLPGSSTPICLPKRSDALRLLQRVRDETHRFATSRNQALRTKANVVSRFESLPHIGKKRAKLIITKYKTLETFEMKCRDFPEEVAEFLSVPVAQVTEAGAAAAKLLASGGAKVHINKRYTAVDEYIEAAEKEEPYETE
ncbi:MAG: excinuclease ABC subunit C, partial [Treponemataceae bacterium]|nr:excinuclease ABC subunit C [Treponemataceae bacterium]